MSASRWAVVVGGVGLVAAACGSSSSAGDSQAGSPAGGSTASAAPSTPTAMTVAVKSHTIGKFGAVLTNSAGRTLYIFTADKLNKSVCNGDCASEWPPVTVPSGAMVSGAPGLTTITRKDGSEQAALNGRPLYTFAGDKAAGQTRGQGDDGDWFLVTTKGVSHVDAGKKKDHHDGDDDD